MYVAYKSNKHWKENSSEIIYLMSANTKLLMHTKKSFNFDNISQVIEKDHVKYIVPHFVPQLIVLYASDNIICRLFSSIWSNCSDITFTNGFCSHMQWLDVIKSYSLSLFCFAFIWCLIVIFYEIWNFISSVNTD